MAIYRFSIITFLLIFCSYGVVGQTDTLPSPTMTSNRLITLDYYNPDIAYEESFLNMMNQTSAIGQKKKVFQRRGAKFILPSLFVAYGVSARFNDFPTRQFDFDLKHEVDKIKKPNAHYSIDNYLEIAIPVLAYGLAFIPGIESSHNFRDRTLIMATSYMFMEGVVYTIKRTVPVLRPRGWGLHSFPSGHMAVAMTGAHILFKEYKHISPWIGVSGYLLATVTGAFRIINNAHWLSDVIMSAGIGMLSAEVGYMMLPVWHSIFGIKDSEKRFVAIPTISTQSIGLGLVYQF